MIETLLGICLKGNINYISGNNGLLGKFTEKADEYLDKLLIKYSGVASNG